MNKLFNIGKNTMVKDRYKQGWVWEEIRGNKKKKENVYICETKGNMNISKIWKVRLNVSNYL